MLVALPNKAGIRGNERRLSRGGNPRRHLPAQAQKASVSTGPSNGFLDSPSTSSRWRSHGGAETLWRKIMVSGNSSAHPAPNADQVVAVASTISSISAPSKTSLSNRAWASAWRVLTCFCNNCRTFSMLCMIIPRTSSSMFTAVASL